MEPLNSRDQQRLEELQARLETVEPGVDVLPAVVDTLREALNAERGLAYGVDIGPERYQVSYTHISGFPMTSADAHASLDSFVGTRRDPWGYFNPACPQPSQRNRELQFQAPNLDAPPIPPPQDERLTLWKTLDLPAEERARVQAQVKSNVGTFLQGCGLDRMMFLRVLVCDGPALLGWVGAMRTEPFEGREVRLLRELIPSLQRRLTLDTRLREAGVFHAALEAALEALGQAAYVVTSTGRVAFANSMGRARLERDTGLVAEALKRYLRGEPLGGELTFTPLRLSGTPTHYLAVVQGEPLQALARVHALSTGWGLTAREMEVLGRLVRGESNKAIALHLGCAERTVEVHVTRILAKAQVESRSALIAKCFLAT
ncbi:helix-turn-helix transcriptional regulator [Archangium lansingense]|uniref:Helix-turn-helix transcriptional regulator n=1 Tax=Archangium lansingense TaxID=2995310 RepID=A0ABT4AL38_9BACT|nr:helix-turn-helix transcriptional regulator [Archangium lansinium]MCY1082408.1 helix-turn-helix transcriptional regulator [Archangium lansinium]